MIPPGHFGGGQNHGAADVFGKVSGLEIHFSPRLFHQAEGADEPAREPQPAHGEILYGPLGLGAVEGIRGDSDLAHGIALDAELAHEVSH